MNPQAEQELIEKSDKIRSREKRYNAVFRVAMRQCDIDLVLSTKQAKDKLVQSIRDWYVTYNRISYKQRKVLAAWIAEDTYQSPSLSWD